MIALPSPPRGALSPTDPAGYPELRGALARALAEGLELPPGLTSSGAYHAAGGAPPAAELAAEALIREAALALASSARDASLAASSLLELLELLMRRAYAPEAEPEERAEAAYVAMAERAARADLPELERRALRQRANRLALELLEPRLAERSAALNRERLAELEELAAHRLLALELAAELEELRGWAREEEEARRWSEPREGSPGSGPRALPPAGLEALEALEEDARERRELLLALETFAPRGA